MSDFIYSSVSKPKKDLVKCIQSIYHNDPPEVKEFHGDWGSLAVSKNLYNGFQPFETYRHIFVVIGGPVLCFRDNRFLTGSNPVAGTQAIYERYFTGKICWDEDLSGPFAVLSIDKIDKKITGVTDLMMFIPVYNYLQNGKLMLGTHVDMLARTAGQLNHFDFASLVDFILNKVVTYPYTVYKHIKQCRPAAIMSFNLVSGDYQAGKSLIYWQPNELNPYAEIDEAAKALRRGLFDYITRVTEGMTKVAQFLSAGEDSRVIAGILPKTIKRDAFIFLDSMNLEGRIAKRIASIYDINFHVKFRDSTHYLDILSEASDLIGGGHQYVHAHSLGFHKICKLDQYTAVFGGYIADSLLKGANSPKIHGFGKFSWISKVFVPGENRGKPPRNVLFLEEILKIIDRRRQKHIKTIKEIRKDSAHEWFILWPATMRGGIPNLYSNRRLFCSYEPFMCKEVVKIAAAAPAIWKFNGRLFNHAFRSALKDSRWVLSGDCRLPYFCMWVNIPIQFVFRPAIKSFVKCGILRNQGPWGDWRNLLRSEKWNNAILRYSGGFELIKEATKTDDISILFKEKTLNRHQKINLLQILALGVKSQLLT